MYQGRYKAIGIESDEHMLTACRTWSGIRCGLASLLARKTEMVQSLAPAQSVRRRVFE